MTNLLGLSSGHDVVNLILQYYTILSFKFSPLPTAIEVCSRYRPSTDRNTVANYDKPCAILYLSYLGTEGVNFHNFIHTTNKHFSRLILSNHAHNPQNTVTTVDGNLLLNAQKYTWRLNLRPCGDSF